MPFLERDINDRWSLVARFLANDKTFEASFTKRSIQYDIIEGRTCISPFPSTHEAMAAVCKVIAVTEEVAPCKTLLLENSNSKKIVSL